jgi:siroheme synthase
LIFFATEASVRKLVGVTSLIAALAGAGVPVTAHHSHSMFDTSREVTISGTVTSYSYRNPHVFLYVDVKGENNEAVSWAVEMSNITNMQRRGIQRSTFKVGDTVTVRLNPLKDGRPGGNYTSVIAADGKTYE